MRAKNETGWVHLFENYYELYDDNGTLPSKWTDDYRLADTFDDIAQWVLATCRALYGKVVSKLR